MASIKINGLGSAKSDRVYAPKKGTSSFSLIRDGLTLGFGENQ
jgi:hypothetical protein